ncbi:MAG: hypothetical protein IPO40_17890 [Fibrobacteres bacterium]|nr:hypothetical protein [Fibrobacterota bacterium]
MREYDIAFPPFPEIAESEYEECAKRLEFSPILFEWYKLIGVLCCSICSIARRSPIWVIEPTNIQYGILVGLINRCAKLILSNMALSFEGKNGEATSIIDRCIFETAIKIQWLCLDLSPDKFARYLSEGLKSDVVAKEDVLENIRVRGYQTEIEKRILAAIEKRIFQSKMTEDQIVASMKLHDLATMIRDLNLPRTQYVFGQKLGSHNVHGNWSALLWFNLNVDSNGEFSPNDNFAPTAQDQYAATIRNVLSALGSYLNCFGIKCPEIESEINKYFEKIDGEVTKICSILLETDLAEAK